MGEKKEEYYHACKESDDDESINSNPRIKTMTIHDMESATTLRNVKVNFLIFLK